MARQILNLSASARSGGLVGSDAAVADRVQGSLLFTLGNVLQIHHLG
jgi:hypothetical protein